jgi:SAM-dependent methyltransferase
MRKVHNTIKRHLIENVSFTGAKVLDVGCGNGGDLFKWRDSHVNLWACDPDKKSLTEARRRAGTDTNIHFFNGDVNACRESGFDIICYNFSFQYTFSTRDLFIQTMNSIHRVSKIGTLVVGIIPDSTYILSSQLKRNFGDNVYFTRDETTGVGDFGEMLNVYIGDTLYYKNGPIAEPIAYKDVIITEFENRGFVLEKWLPIIPYFTGTISELYSEFSFRKITSV